ncbi:MAG: RNA 2',3'-cyclic phosphodiesterase [Deltaproteobacteria bacterium]
MSRVEGIEREVGRLDKRALGEVAGRALHAEPTIRAFVALALPPPLRRFVAAISRRLSESPACRSVRARFLPEEGLHVTLKFLGRVETGRLPAIRAALSEAARLQAPLRLTLHGVGCFPDPARPKVLWIGLGGDVQALGGLAGEVDKRLLPLGFRPEDRAFNPHLTLCRLASTQGARDLAAALFALEEEISGELRGDELVLFRSETLPDGARHVPLFRIPFGAERLLC